jgi:hypothetical protein
VKSRIGLRLDEQSRNAWMLPADLGLDGDDALLDVVGALIVGKFDAQRRDHLGRRRLRRQQPVGPEYARRMSRDVEDRS